RLRRLLALCCLRRLLTLCCLRRLLALLRLLTLRGRLALTRLSRLLALLQRLLTLLLARALQRPALPNRSLLRRALRNLLRLPEPLELIARLGHDLLAILIARVLRGVEELLHLPARLLIDLTLLELCLQLLYVLA